MSELIIAVFAISILIVAWMIVRIGERLSKLENRYRRLERTQNAIPGKVIGSQSERVQEQESRQSSATPS